MTATLTHNALMNSFLEIVSQFPNITALIDSVNNYSLTYQELLTAVEAQSAEYKNYTGKPVILCEQNSIDWVVQFLALQLAGAIAVPVHVHLSDIEKSVIQGTISQSIELPDNIAVIFHTSGTTGQPKGVMLSADNLLFDVKANCDILALTPADVLVSMSPFSHVYGLVNVLLSTLLTGATLIILPGFHPKKILDAIEQHQVTVLIAVPTMYHSLLSVYETHPKNLLSLRVCHSGAAPMSVALFHQLESVFNAPVQEGYGLSEATSIVTSNPLQGLRKPGSIGLPLKGLEIKFDDNNQLYIKGPTVMQGYYQHSELTHNNITADNWLATGDIVTQDDDGYLFWHGRMDDVINVAGEKVYPKEVEEIIYQNADVALCAVKAIPCDIRFQRVSAFVVKKETSLVENTEFIKQLMQACRNNLAAYKVPFVIHIVDSIPTTPSGKIKRGELLL